MSDWVGQTLSKVEVQKLLGRGGMADVYLGRHTTLNRPVAVKVLHAHLTENDSLLGRFRGEAQAVASMRHPNIVQVFDFDIVNDRPYIVMELLEGVSLKDYLSTQRNMGRRVPPDTITRLITALSSALDYAHTRGIVHRDVKPANVMLRREGGELNLTAPLPGDVEPILTDFGIARLADASVQTASGVIIGTPAYMSPEQVKGDPVDARSDIYSLGIMLYEMLAGVLPFDGDTQASILIKHINEPPPPLPDSSPAVQRVIDRALAKNPAERFQRASDLSAALEAALAGQDTGAVTEAIAPQRSRLPDEHSTPSFSLRPESETAVGSGLGAQTTPGRNTQTVPTRPVPVPWIVGGVGGVVILIMLFMLLNGRGEQSGQNIPTQAAGIEPTTATEEFQPTDAATPTEEAQATDAPGVNPADVQGEASFRDSELSVALSGVSAPPSGSAYEAWLIEPEGVPLRLGVVEARNGNLVLEYADSEGQPLLSQYSSFAISVEPASDSDPAMSDTVLYQAQIEPELLGALRLLYSEHDGEPLQQAALVGMLQQAQHFDSHLGFVMDAIASNNLAGSKTHAEHVINIAVGQNSPDFLDWNGNGRPENPGDSVGLMNYLLTLRAALPAGDASSGVAAQIEGLLGQVEDMVDLAKRISDADTIEEVAEFGAEMEGVQTQPVIGILIAQVESMNLTVRVPVEPVTP